MLRPSDHDLDSSIAKSLFVSLFVLKYMRVCIIYFYILCIFIYYIFTYKYIRLHIFLVTKVLYGHVELFKKKEKMTVLAH